MLNATGPILLVAMSLASQLGCGRSQQGLVPVEGIVTLDGAPMARVYVFFDQPTAARNNAFIGQTDEQGHFVLRPAGDKNAGAPAGSYRVTLTTAVAKPGSPDGTPLPPERVPPKYGNGKLNYEVSSRGTKDANFEMKKN
jgi:hypothetical protein